MSKKLVQYGLGVLSIVNLAALGTIAYSSLSVPPKPVLPAGADPRMYAPMARRGFLFRQLNLSEKQAGKMRTLQRDFQQSVRLLQRHIGRKRATLIDLLMAAELDRAQIYRTRSEIDSLQAAIQRLTIDHLIAEKQLLRPDQQRRFFRILQKQLLRQHRGRQRGMRNGKNFLK